MYIYIWWTTILTSFHSLSSPKVQLGDTTLVGRRLKPSNLDFFGGIPFADPPLRFAPAHPKFSLAPLRSFNARSYGLSCLQPVDADMSENCLTLNIFRPSGIENVASLPVMVWIHGGGFYSGASSIYDGSPLVKQSIARGTPILFVSMNYRVGPLGFPQGPEAVERAALNLGLRDQWAALEWVQRNIASFGGDPNKVTVFGQSAGALSASYHYLNENFSTVARAAIFQSGIGSSLPLFDAHRGIPSWMLFANNTQPCAMPAPSPNNTFSCLMSASSLDIHAGMKAAMAIELFPFRPLLDGPGGILGDFPARQVSRGAGKQVPFMAGTVLDEGTVFVPQDFKAGDITIWLNANYSPSPFGSGALKAGLEKLMSLYPDAPSAGSPFGTGNETFGTGPGYKRGAAIIGDMFFQAPRRFWSQTTSAFGTPSYAYIFTDPQPDATPAHGVFHSSELYYLFRDLTKKGPLNTARLRRIMLDYWISFAVSLTPNDGKGTQRPYWETYDEAKKVLELNSNSTGLVPDVYRSFSIDFIIKMSDMLSL
ncbi:esterase 1 [Multifurca ochricompacta]|uniref:Carboxylic ester hydrolase n=1 Tax=Multifurca ochricompacta TaxID=376703 RepID=A0AAD4MDT5_9AGAM|nr:esterase 1 [Multifurca ochricompacta]